MKESFFAGLRGGLKRTAHDAVIAGKIAAPIAVALAPVGLPAEIGAALVQSLHASQNSQTIKTEIPEMNTLETFAITMVLGILQTTIKNPAHKAALQGQLVGIATDIFEAYGMAVPAASGAAVTAT